MLIPGQYFHLSKASATIDDNLYKFDTGFYEMIQEMQSIPNGGVQGQSTSMHSVIIITDNGNEDMVESVLEKLGAQNIFKSYHLDFLIADVPINNIVTLASYDFIYKLGDGQEELYSQNLSIAQAKPFVGASNIPSTIYPYTGSGITVAVIDSLVDFTHPDLQNKNAGKVLCTPRSCTSTNNPTGDHGTSLAAIIAANSVDTSKNGIAPAPAIVPPTPTLSSSSPCDESSSSLACYYYTRYTDRCLPTYTTSRCNTYATQITTAGYTLPTSSETTTPVTPVTVVEKHPTNVVATLNGDSITVTWTAPSYEVDRYKVYPYEDNKRQSRTYVTTESFTYNSIEEGSEYKFKVRAYYEDRQNGRSSSSYVYSNVVSVPVSVPEPVIPGPVVPIIPEIPTILPTISTFDIFGGNKLIHTYNNGTLDKSFKSTITIGGIDTNGDNGIVVAGHALVKKDHTHVGYAVVDNYGNKTDIVPTKHSVFLNNNVDAGFISIGNSNVTIHNQIQYQNGIVLNVTDGNLRTVNIGESLKIFGIESNGEGLLLFKNATIFDRPNLFKNMGIALYPNIGGDSGAPIIHQVNDISNLVGVHKGGVCIFESSSENQTRIDVSGYSSLCDRNQYYYKVFSDWENVKSILNLQ